MNIKKVLTYKLIRRLTVYLFFAVGFIILGYASVHQTSNSKFCSQCHSMKPEFNTWKASSHNQVECVSCHIPPGTVNFLKQKAKGLNQVYLTMTDSYTGPIIMPRPIPNRACEKCHNMDTRNVTPKGDIIIPHDKHDKEGINCTKCHSGVAHGSISKRKVTYKTDYQNWNASVGKVLMSDQKYIRPDMDTCMKCHQLRKAPLECKACHYTEMLPDNHRDQQLKNGRHGKFAAENIQECHTCHEYMSKQPIEGFTEQPKYKQYLKKDSSTSTMVTVNHYAKTNTFCKECHAQRPPTHRGNQFMARHGAMAGKEQSRCLTCHDNNVQGEIPATQVACGSCHPSPHNRPWKQSHPIPFGEENVKVTDFCYTCHSHRMCGSCHTPAASTNE